MLQLHFSLSSTVLFIALWKNEEFLTSIQKENSRLHSENFLSHLREILTQTNHSLSEVENFYFTSQPSGQTGLRLSLTFLATCQVISPKVKIYHFDTLLFQAGSDKCISLLTIDRQARRYHAAVYQNKKCLTGNLIIASTDLKKIRQRFPNFPQRKDLTELNFLTNFQKLKSEFVLLENLTDIELN